MLPTGTDTFNEHWRGAGPEGARTVLTAGQAMSYASCASFLVLFTLWDYKIAFAVLNFIVCGFYMAAISYKALCVLLSVVRRPEIRVEPAAGGADELPVYTVLVPLYKEANIVDGVLAAMKRLDYPPEKLEVKLLVEADDAETAAACLAARLPVFCEVVTVPLGSPRTKPRACNAGLALARGEFLVIYDAEDRPDPDQLRKAVAAFRQQPADTACLQCKLNYYNADQNVLTRFFTLEYTLWFDLFLPGLHALKAPIPLGGTSNHFRIEALRELNGWDPFNLTEDCDLGIRLAQAGYRTKVLDSTTWEEANSRLWNWVRQRSRWVKGYIQTHWVHTRSTLDLLGRLGAWGSASFLLTVGGLSAMLLLNPLYWVMVALWAFLRWKLLYFDFTDETMTTYTVWSKLSWVFCGAALMLFLANFLFVAMNVVACFRRRLWRLIPYALLSPLYWALISVGAWKGFIQLIHKPFYWEKTQHGLHVAKAEPGALAGAKEAT
ncbi:MAG TPA: glycosyltransferase [Candidatus Brocadiia bacterium]|nr:glycosyltransferase [Candidatus Brocadiia bacterium]